MAEDQAVGKSPDGREDPDDMGDEELLAEYLSYAKGNPDYWFSSRRLALEHEILRRMKGD